MRSFVYYEIIGGWSLDVGVEMGVHSLHFLLYMGLHFSAYYEIIGVDCYVRV